ncbi:hypothetical protein [Candidatus Thiodictyon syntrophicum]|jgi:HlyD family secretion protein|uniref:RND efflux pump membrane fusion protein barrel-sandwich domain-containing protein n=1 Tax=Candidatus Thiodictyon syntrophicum TaxID=1166950 RepID=A0A2K8U9F8_9GAMM|nr:hypothetical protein [Candidatus Thiodictyon syntrophicum]AUB82232.1 hypothetical protein THSYN_15600 [Candidatus Thiodictyon syntrophicum]
MQRRPPSIPCPPRLPLCLFLVWALAGTLEVRAADPEVPARDLPSPAPRTVIAALGRVEPLSEEIRIAAAMTGRLAEVLLDEGQPVTRSRSGCRWSGTAVP